MPPIQNTLFEGRSFGMHHSRDVKPDNSQFILHNHDDLYELVLFLNGDAMFHAEGSVYNMRPYDMALTRPGELHRMQCSPQKPYERTVLYIAKEHLESEDMRIYADIFENRALGVRNIIGAEIVRESLLDCFNRIYKYSQDRQYAVAEAVLIEFLYLLNNASVRSVSPTTRDKRVAVVIQYINNHLGDSLRLDELAEMVYIDKYHLCRVFKKCTGYTLNGYINYKRLLLVKELHAQGQSLLEASINAGFNNYSHFYRMYVKQNGTSPKNM